MGVDIYLGSGKKEFSCRLYWITDLIDQYGWQFKEEISELKLGKKLNRKEIKQLLNFLEFSFNRLTTDKDKTLKKYDSDYFKKVEKINSSIEYLINFLKKKRTVDKKIFPKLRGLIRRLENYKDYYRYDPEEQKEEIKKEYEEKIMLVKKIISLLRIIVTKGGRVSIE